MKKLIVFFLALYCFEVWAQDPKPIPYNADFKGYVRISSLKAKVSPTAAMGYVLVDTTTGQEYSASRSSVEGNFIYSTGGNNVMYQPLVKSNGDTIDSKWEPATSNIPYNYGNLYNWYAVNTGKLAPPGWHVPTETDFNLLISTIGGSLIGGGKIKSTKISNDWINEIGWRSPNVGADNQFGFNGLPSGFRYFDASFQNIGMLFYIWSSTEFGALNARCLNIYYDTASIGISSGTKKYGFPIRLIRDDLVGYTTEETVTDEDNNIYETTLIGTQVWMTQNLKTTKYNDGTEIPNVTDSSSWAELTTGAYCTYNNLPLSTYEDSTYYYTTTSATLIQPKYSKKVSYTKIDGLDTYIASALDTISTVQLAIPIDSVIGLDTALWNKATNFPGIDAQTPITNANIYIDTVTKILSIQPPLGYFDINVDGNGISTRIRKTGDTLKFPAYTNTSGYWYFYYNASGTAVTTQTHWNASDFNVIAPVYRILINSSLAGNKRLVSQYIEYHLNTISASEHEHNHLLGAIWGGGTGNFDIKTNALATASPDGDGRNTVVALTSGRNIDDNLPYTVTNSTNAIAWNQNMGNTTPASINSTNSGLFKVFTQDASSRISFLDATRFPFPYSATNVPQFITSTGTRTAVTNGRFMVVFIYATQNPVSGEAIKVVCATSDFTSIANARAYTWANIINTYSTFANDFEIRPLYRLIYEVRTGAPSAYNIACRYSALRETQDIRTATSVSQTSVAGSLPASSVTYLPTSPDVSTNAQTALDNRVLKGVTTSGQYASLRYVQAIATTTFNVDFNNGNVQKIVLASGANTLAITTPLDGGRYVLIVKQPASGAAGTLTWDVKQVWGDNGAPTLSTTNNKIDLISIIYDATEDKYFSLTATGF